LLLADYAKILYSIPIPSFVFQDKQIRFANKKFAEATGYSEQELEKIAPNEFIHPGDLSRITENIANCYAGIEIDHSIEFRTFAKTGEIVCVLGCFARIELNGAPAILVQSIDISMRKQTEALLRVHHDLSQALSACSNLTDAFNFILDAGLQVDGIDCGGIYLVDQITGNLELAAHKGLSDNFFRAVSFYKHDTPQALIVKEGSPFFGNYPNDRLNKQQAKEELKFFATIPVLNEGRVIAALNLASHSVNEFPLQVRNMFESMVAQIGSVIKRIKAETDLKAANQRLMDIIDFLPDATFVIDNRGVVIAWNKSIENMTGVRKEDIMGKGDYIYSLPFYGSPRPILIDIVLDPNKIAEEKYEKLVKKEGSLVAETYVASVYKGKGATLWGIASLLLDIDGNTVGAIESIRDITDKRDIEENLKQLGLHDALTGIYNRTFFEEEMKRASDGRYDPIGIVICDLDALKFVNDTIGHDVGDSLLVATAEVIKNNFRKCDIVSRIGGDEFAILIPHTSEDAMEEIVSRLRGSFNNYNLLNPILPINISIGYSVGGVVDMITNDIFKEADNRMYRDKLHRSKSARSAIVETLMKALEVRDFITEGHAIRLYDYVRNLAEIIGMPDRIISELGLLAKFHDIGKVGVPDSILFKQGPLTPVEIVEMRRHCEIGHRIAKSSPDLEPIADWILKHHEWWNGAGYPIGLKGEEIPLECRILAIVDSYDAMTSDRPYRKAMTHEHAIKELIKCGGSQFDPSLVSRFIEMLEKRKLVS